MNLAIIGTGYVGLVTGTCFAETGNNVVCVDIDEKKVEKLRAGVITIYEPGLDVLFERNIQENRLHFTTDLAEAVAQAQLIFLALPTPPGESGAADLSYILAAAEQIGKIIAELPARYRVIVNKSTVPVGTAEKVHAVVAQYFSGEFDVVSNPEFLREGVAVDDFLRPDRVVVGAHSAKARRMMEELYAPFVRQGNPVIFMDERSAEMTKYAANAYLAARISFMNEIANLCELTGADVEKVRQGMGGDSRIGKRFLFPGVGFGGSCFPKDVRALLHAAGSSGYDFHILRSVLDVNARQRLVLVKKLRDYFQNDLQGKNIAVWGLTFKPNTDDIREAPALYIIDELLGAGANLHVYDPEGMENVRRVYGDRLVYAAHQYDVLQGADALLIVTEWSAFRSPDFERMAALMKHKAIFDGRNLYSLETLRETEFYYESIGRSKVMPIKINRFL